MLKIYQALVRMRYLDLEWFQRGPHDISALMPVYELLGLDPRVIYLYCTLPYINPLFSKSVDFYNNTGFADFRQKDNVRDAQEPYPHGEPGFRLRPWMTPLSTFSRYMVVIYDANRHIVELFDDSLGKNVDPNIHEGSLGGA
ncbi:hypothetical protein N0V88_007613 [Collariella sp. IMI 366227]|nr:hypothetical protein N0V88_007613 [Collariella sp. IMI 366227]